MKNRPGKGGIRERGKFFTSQFYQKGKEMTAQTFVDPWDAAEQAKEPQFSNIIWGQCEASSWFCVLEKGVGKVAFDPQMHNLDLRRTAIDIIIHPLADMGLTFDLARNMIAESYEWAGVVLPSIRDLGISPKQLNGSWIKVQTVPLTDKSGNVVTYTDKNGTVKEKTTLKFLAIFKDDAECRADYLANSGKAPQQDTQYAKSNGNGNGNGNGNKERETAFKFLKVYVENACRGQSDLNVIRQTLALNIAQQPLISKYFTVDSSEVVEMIAKEMSK